MCDVCMCVCMYVSVCVCVCLYYMYIRYSIMFQCQTGRPRTPQTGRSPANTKKSNNANQTNPTHFRTPMSNERLANNTTETNTHTHTQLGTQRTPRALSTPTASDNIKKTRQRPHMADLGWGTMGATTLAYCMYTHMHACRCPHANARTRAHTDIYTRDHACAGSNMFVMYVVVLQIEPTVHNISYWGIQWGKFLCRTFQGEALTQGIPLAMIPSLWERIAWGLLSNSTKNNKSPGEYK